MLILYYINILQTLQILLASLKLKMLTQIMCHCPGLNQGVMVAHQLLVM